ncbi:unnamed protein product [Cyclocybe aegerita]|uniref:Zn(2)-C6 fungal-type domain-containing protein n=1 Tax=Cyclocybe aegerita TaxID=1973307 RepID=A0A8S0XQY0_CYCAE|nr:unnamed protein product [Cyclocybe aegerita]
MGSSRLYRDANLFPVTKLSESTCRDLVCQRGTHPSFAMSSSSSSKRSEGSQGYLPRGGACVSCRRRKMKCDGQHPICGQCERAGRAEDCEYTAGSERSTVQILEDNISRLEARIQELQNPNSANAAAVRLHQPYMGGAPPMVPGHSQGRGLPVPAPSSSFQRPTVQDPPRNVAETLLATFMPYATDFGFFLHLPRFRASMFQAQAPGHPARPAPALIFSVYLWAIRLSNDPTMQANEEAYLTRATQEASTALLGNHPNKVMHSIQAEVLLANYFFAQGRFLEGKYHLATAVSTALSAGLHKIRSASPGGGSPVASVGAGNNQLAPARDAVEEGERIIAGWTVFTMDKVWAVALDYEPNFLHSTHAMGTKIDTPWPLEIEEFEQGVLPQHVRTSNTVHNFLSRAQTPDAGVSSRALEAKAAILWERVADFCKKHNLNAQTNPQSIQSALQEFTSLSNILDAQTAAMPPATAASLHPTRLPSIERARRLVVAHSMLDAAAIRLHAPFAADGRSESSRRKRVGAARSVLEGTLALRGRLAQAGHPAGWIDPIIGTAWIEAAQVLFDEVTSIRTMRASSAHAGDEAPLLGYIQQAMTAMSDFAVNIPLLSFQVGKIQETFTSF